MKILTILDAYSVDQEIPVRLDICLDQVAFMTRENDRDEEDYRDDEPEKHYPVTLTTRAKYEHRTEMFFIKDIDADRIIQELNKPEGVN